MNSVIAQEPSQDSFWPPAVFVQEKDGECYIYYIEKERQEGEDALDVVIDIAIESQPRYFGVLYKTENFYGEFDEMHSEVFLSLLIADVHRMEYFEAPIYKSDSKLHIKNWQEKELYEFPEEAVLIRRAMCPQG